jgi:monovalent cation:H+ antiporter-2, CPA2 family
MDHEIPLITTLVAALGFAFVFGALASWLRVSPVVGSLFAGVGPYES